VDETRSEPAATAPGEPGEPDQRDDDLARLRRERDVLAVRVAALEHRRARRGRARHGAIAVLLVLGTACFTMSAVGWWARRNVADTDVWMSRVETLPQEPAVQAALGNWLTGKVVELIDPQNLFEEVLPERGQLLAAPLAGAVEGFVRDRIDGFVASDAFQQLWVVANERAHRRAIQVLRGETDIVRAGDDRVEIDLAPIIDGVLADIGRASPELLGRQVDLPQLSVDDLPDRAVVRLEDALGIQLDDDFGRIEVYDRGRLRALQDGLERARRWLVGLSVLTVACFAAALWLSDRRRRTLLQMFGALALGIALIRRLGIRGQRELLASIPDDVNRAAADAVSDRFLGPLLDTTRTLLGVVGVLAALVVVTGPYPWVVRLRQRTAELGRGAWAAVTRSATDRTEVPGGAWVEEHAGLLRAAGVVLVVAVLLVADLSFFELLVLAALVALGALLIDRMATPAPTATPAGGEPDDPRRPG
jgi:hypothetical protein